MADVSIEALKQAVESLHKCEAEFQELVQATERFESELVWEGDVYIFGIEGHPEAKKCYAWSLPVEGSDRRRFYTPNSLSAYIGRTAIGSESS